MHMYMCMVCMHTWVVLEQNRPLQKKPFKIVGPHHATPCYSSFHEAFAPCSKLLHVCKVWPGYKSKSTGLKFCHVSRYHYKYGNV